MHPEDEVVLRRHVDEVVSQVEELGRGGSPP
ncbi:hypothetical protein SAMN04489747_0176 [Auraticoccus monumenti]|uniref:Uncharacterized protein n=1 Tax=Auraticoccus monumenti TaxID=675864 RepID=A0A1G6S204_9ACTN|nr:hypothetical protein SAMN04489747_0176 [Auraticoccus monumenti]